MEVESPQESKISSRLKDKKRWYWKFAQQKLPGWAPIITPNVIVLYFFCTSIFCVALGIPILTASLSVKEYSVRYDNQGQFANGTRDEQAALAQSNPQGIVVPVSLTVKKDMKPPIYVFYQLDKYYQNHKRYVRSRSDNQLGGKGSASSSCSPEQYVNGSANPALAQNGAIDPCGLIAWSFFNDTFTAKLASSNVNVSIDESNIAWSYDADHLYGNSMPENFNIFYDKRGGNTSIGPLNENQHLMVWLRPAAQPSFRKLWGRIDTTLPSGTVLNIEVVNRYNTYNWGGGKHFVISTNSWVGGKNLFLGIVYLVVSGLAMVTCLAFLVCYHCGLVRKRKFGDLSELSWQRRS